MKNYNVLSTARDMSTTCGNGYFAKWDEYNAGLITAEEFNNWYDEHCAKCKYMYEICMYGEE